MSSCVPSGPVLIVGVWPTGQLSPASSSRASWGPAVVGALANRRLHRELEGQRILRDVDELRIVLDQAAGQLEEIDMPRLTATLTLLQTVDKLDSTDAAQLVGALQQTLHEIRGTTERLRIRLGILSPVVAAHENLAAHLGDFSSAAWAIAMAFHARARDSLDIDVDAERAKVDAAQAAYNGAKRDWYGAAHALVRSRLEPTPSRARRDWRRLRRRVRL